MDETEVVPALDEAVMAKRRKNMRKLLVFRHLSDEQLNEMILHPKAQKKAGKRRRSTSAVQTKGSTQPSWPTGEDELPVDPEEVLPVSWRLTYRKIVKKIIASVKDDVTIDPLLEVIENLAYRILLERRAMMMGATLRELKELGTLIQTGLTNLGLTEPRRHIANKRSEDSLQDALSLSETGVKRAQGARTVGHEKMKALLDAKPQAVEEEEPDGES